MMTGTASSKANWDPQDPTYQEEEAQLRANLSPEDYYPHQLRGQSLAAVKASRASAAIDIDSLAEPLIAATN